MNQSTLSRINDITKRLSMTSHCVWSVSEIVTANEGEDIQKEDIDFITHAFSDCQLLLEMIKMSNQVGNIDVDKLSEIYTRFSKMNRAFWRSWVEGRDHWGGDTMLEIEPCDTLFPRVNISLPKAKKEDYDFLMYAKDDIPWLYHHVHLLQKSIENIE